MQSLLFETLHGHLTSWPQVGAAFSALLLCVFFQEWHESQLATAFTAHGLEMAKQPRLVRFPFNFDNKKDETRPCVSYASDSSCKQVAFAYKQVLFSIRHPAPTMW
jgi:hypothetical protein